MFDYIICFWDKSKIRVDEETGEKLKNAIKLNNIKHFELGGCLYSIAGVEKIITVDEAYIVFPAEYEYLSDMQNRLPTKETMIALEEANKNPIGLNKLQEIKTYDHKRIGTASH